MSSWNPGWRQANVPDVYTSGGSELMTILEGHGRGRSGRRWRIRGWMFPSRTGGLRYPSSLHKPWLACLAAIGIDERFTIHGLWFAPVVIGVVITRPAERGTMRPPGGQTRAVTGQVSVEREKGLEPSTSTLANDWSDHRNLEKTAT
jgi:hypothetical protein